MLEVRLVILPLALVDRYMLSLDVFSLLGYSSPARYPTGAEYFLSREVQFDERVVERAPVPPPPLFMLLLV